MCTWSTAFCAALQTSSNQWQAAKVPIQGLKVSSMQGRVSADLPSVPAASSISSRQCQRKPKKAKAESVAGDALLELRNLKALCKCTLCPLKII